MKILIFDTETTGLIENRTVKLEKQPHVIEYFGQLVDLTNGEVLDEFGSLVKPPIPLPRNVKGNKGIAEMTGITEDMLVGKPTFKDIAPEVRALVAKAPGVLAHNLAFDMDMVEIEFERMGEDIKSLWPKRRVCTIEQTMHLRGFRLNLTRLHELLFPGVGFVAHRADNDVKALARCAVELFKRGVL